jgi:urease accessory protein
MTLQDKNMTVNQFGTVSKLYITVQGVPSDNGAYKTVIADSYFTAPFKIMKPFQRKDGGITVYQQTASAGIMAGDEQDQQFTVGEHADLELVSQSFEKIFKMENGEHAVRRITADVSPSGTLYIAPLPCIPFSGSDFTTSSFINLADSASRLLYEDCICCGRKGHGEEFAYRQYRSRIEIQRAGKLIYRDNTVFTGSDCGSLPLNESFLRSDAMYGRYSHAGNLLLFGFGKTAAEISTMLGLPEKFLYTSECTGNNDSIIAGVTTISSGDIAVRALGTSAEQVQDFFARVRENINS